MELEPNRAVLEWPLGRGDVGREVWYLLATTADGEVAFWYHVEFVSTGDRQLGRSLAAVTTRDGTVRFASQAVDPANTRFETRPFRLQTASERITSRAAAGTINDEVETSWELTFDPDTYAFTPLRSHRLTRLLSNTIGTGRHWSRNQSVLMDGTVTVSDTTYQFESAPGHQGHTVSWRRPSAHTWLHCNDFDTSGSRADDVTLEALQYDDLLSVCLRLDGEVYAFNRVLNVLPYGPFANTVERNEVGEWRFRAGRSDALRVSVEADEDCWVRTTQFDPEGGLHYDAHCPFATVSLTYTIGDDWATVSSDTARVEWVRDSPPVDGEYAPSWDE